MNHKSAKDVQYLASIVFNSLGESYKPQEELLYMK